MKRTFLFVAAAAIACSSSKSEQREDTGAAAQGAQGAQAGTMCPARVPGTTVRAEDTGDGVAMVFTTTDPGSVEDLRQSVSSMARSLESGSMTAGEDVRTSQGAGAGGSGGSSGGAGVDTGTTGPGMGPGPGMGAGPGMHHGMMMNMPPAHADVTSIDRGARMDLTPTDPSQADQLREQVRLHVQAMRDGTCPMMQGATAPPAGG